ncbi:glycerol channel [Ceratocystis pirilliformis]|uniref:Glycerol channel n=1 Tax=Ceratocystis pirilliformis TaxID=259994 RepID=A0ABR3ZDK5_9PEZI
MGIYSDDLEKGYQNPYYTPEPKLTAMLEYFQDFISEMAGTFTMLWFGLGVNAQVFLSKNSAGDFLSINIAWGCGVFFGYLVGYRSGGHLNPAVTITNVVLRGFPVKKLPFYISGQLLGAMVACLVVYANYLVPITTYDSSTGDHATSLDNSSARIFTTYPQSFMSLEGRFFSEFVTSAMLMIGIYVLDYTCKKGISKVPMPIGLAMLVMALGMSSGWETSYALNPARDFGPRLVSYLLGYGTEVFSASQWYFWVPLVAPCCGCLVGGAVHDLVSGNDESPLRQLLDWISGDSIIKRKRRELILLHSAASSTKSVDTLVA